MKRLLIVLAVALSGLGVFAPATAANLNGPPPGLDPQDVTYDCSDGSHIVTHGGNGRSGWINGEKASLLYGVATYDGEIVWEKSYGDGPSGEVLECYYVDGLFSATLTLVKIQ